MRASWCTGGRLRTGARETERSAPGKIVVVRGGAAEPTLTSLNADEVRDLVERMLKSS
jgi:hypothetical protein